MSSQELRTNQLLFNHGPGAILETKDGPVVMPVWGSLSTSLTVKRSNSEFPDEYEINESRLISMLPSKSIGSSVRVHSIPTNADLGIKGTSYIIRTNKFPNWYICSNNSEHNGKSVLFRDGMYANKRDHCPACKEKGSPIRFVTYCTEGHLDDVNWRYMVCGSNASSQCKSSHILWDEKSPTMSSVNLQCSNCRRLVNLGDASKRMSKCSARNPESLDGGTPSMDCDSPAKITQRQSSVLWQSDTIRVINVPTENPMKRYIEEFFKVPIRNGNNFSDFLDLLRGAYNFDGSESELIKNHINNQINLGMVSDSKRNRFRRLGDRISDPAGFDKFKAAWDAMQNGTESSAIDSYSMEFDGLTKSNPEQRRGSADRKDSDFFMSGESNTGFFGDLKLKVEPIEKLRTVTALTGFTRGAINELSKAPTPVNLGYLDNGGNTWYGGSISYGEGLLITIDSSSPEFFTGGERWTKWLGKHREICDDSTGEAKQDVPWILFRSPRTSLMKDEEWRPSLQNCSEYFAESHPTFVWWHTFAHHFIRAVQAETGYSSSAISERVYAQPNPDGSWSGAVLLYVTEGGMDGTLGGLISLYDKFDKYLQAVAENCIVCSMDPLCEESPSREVPEVGCYACTFNPETSCAHRNMFLDRLLLSEAAGL